MSSFVIKIIAMIAMTFDHIGYFSYQVNPYADYFRMFGRLTFPLLGFLMLEGYTHTRNTNKYMKRLFVFGLITSIPFLYAFGTPFNAMFTYVLGILMLDLLKKYSPKYELIIVLLFFIISIPFDWGPSGIAGFYGASKVKNPKIKIILYVSLVYLSGVIQSIALNVLIYKIPFSLSMLTDYYKFQLPVFLSIPIIYCYNGKKGPSIKYVFYIYYPLHLIIIAYLLK